MTTRQHSTLLLTLPEASEALGGHPSARTLLRLYNVGQFPARKIGRRLFVSRTILEEWAARPEPIAAPRVP